MESIKKYQVLSGSTLKIIAMISMLIDHIGAVIIYQMLIANQTVFALTRNETIDLYYLMRDIGRIAFPIYCFLLVEGFHKTKSRRNYFLRLFILAIISEVPFNFAFRGSFFSLQYQNVFFTLSIGFLCMCAFAELEKYKEKLKGITLVLRLLVGVLGCVLAEAIHTDYGAKGVISILLIYLFYEFKIASLIVGAISFYWELPAPLAFMILAFYNGKRGLKVKYVFYLFYPIHLICLGLILYYMGLVT